MSDTKPLNVVILAGGVGTRLWPISRRDKPKQFQALFSDHTMLQNTYLRVEPLTSPECTWVVTGEEFVDLARQQLPAVPPENVLGEPEPRSSAPAVALAVARIARTDPQALVLSTHADSYIRDAAAYCEYVRLAMDVARVEAIVTLGVVPSRADTGLGYIQRGERLPGPISWAYRVQRFTEKPDADAAARYVADGGYYWNMGHFVFRAEVFMERCRRHLPEVAAGTLKLAAAPVSDRELMAQVYRNLPAISIDRGIAEKEEDLVVIPTALAWSDLGSWGAVKEVFAQHPPPAGRSEQHVAVQSDDCLVLPHSGRLVVTVGVEGYIIVDTPDALLVVRDDKSEELRDALREIERRGKEAQL